MALALALPALLIAAAPAFAQTQEAVPDEVVENLAAAARADMGNALTLGEKPRAETAEERAKPLVSRELERRVVEVGMNSSAFQRCGLNWTRVSFLPFTRAVRATGRYSERQMTYVAMLHGFAHRMMDEVHSGAVTDCPPAQLETMRGRAAALAADIP